MNLCLICLRTDRILKLASKVLAQFHEELCGISVAIMTPSYYCGECEYLLSKFYKFKHKCVNAQKIYHKWISTNTSKNQPSNLYKLLPASPLGLCAGHPDRIGNFTLQAADPNTDSSIKHETIKDITIEVKLERDQSIYNVNNADFKHESNSESNSEPEQIETKTHIEDESESEDSLKLIINEIKVKHKTTKSKRLSKKVPASKKEKLAKIKKPPEKKRANCDKIKENDKMYESVFDVEYLTTPEQVLEEFQRRKTYECYVNAEHKCEVCYQTFKSLKFLQYHTDKWHNESAGNVFCTICKIWSPKASNHRLTHTVVFKCKECPLVTYHRNTMQNHFEQHQGKQYHCEQCNVTCKSKSAFRSHMGKVHRRGRNVCSGCGRGFRSPLGLNIHKKSSSRCTAGGAGAGAGGQGVRCDDCDVTLPSREVYEAHIADVHEPRLHSSGPLTITSAGLPEHRTVSHTRKPRKVKCIRRTPVNVKHTCRVCSPGAGEGCAGARYSWFQLQLHFRREHPAEDVDVMYADIRTHLCDICGTGFTKVYALRDHMTKHTGARPHACDLCPKRFRTAYLARAHRVRHFPSAVPCAYCHMRFKTKGNLYSHMKTHTGEKNYKCDICSKEFLYRANLNEHVRGVHYNIRRVKRGAARGGNQPKGGKIMNLEADDFGSDSTL